MRGDKRKARRHRMRHELWLMLEGGERCDCTLSDISDRGARINVPDSKTIPENFLLLLASTGTARRRCRVIWRATGQVGVKFESRLDDLVRAARTPKADTDALSKAIEPAESGA